MPQPAARVQNLADDLLRRVEQLLLQAHAEGRPVEMSPYREQLFELFVTADAAGFTEEGADPDLSAEGICHALASKWGLAEAARESFDQQQKLTPDQLANMRLLWAVMRLWMDWTYAWKRRHEFHRNAK